MASCHFTIHTIIPESYLHDSGADIIGFEDEHSSILMPLYDDLTFLLDEASMVSKLDLHSLIHDLAEQH